MDNILVIIQGMHSSRMVMLIPLERIGITTMKYDSKIIWE